VAHHHCLGWPRHSTQCLDRRFQPRLVRAHTQVNRARLASWQHLQQAYQAGGQVFHIRVDEGLGPNPRRPVTQFYVRMHSIGMIIHHPLQVLARQRLYLLNQPRHQVIIQSAHSHQVTGAARPPGGQPARLWGGAIQAPDALTGIDGKPGLVQSPESRRLVIHLSQQVKGPPLSNLCRHLVKQGRQARRVNARLGRQESQAGKRSPAVVRHLPDQWLTLLHPWLTQVGEDAGARCQRGQDGPSRHQDRAAGQELPAV